MADTAKLQRMIRNFKSNSRPNSLDQSAPCTVGDINEVIDNLAKVLQAIVKEME